MEVLNLRNNNSRVPDFNSFKTSSGDKKHVQYDSYFSHDGSIKLKEAGCIDIQAKINSFASQCDMALIISKLRAGDTSVLSSKRPMYGDFTNMPTSFAEAFDLVHKSEKAFEALPTDIKKQFDNDRSKWFSSIGSDSWLRAMGFISDSDGLTVTPDVVKEGAVTE